MTEKELIQQYVNQGVHIEKIIYSTAISACIWSVSRNCLLDEPGCPHSLEIIIDSSEQTRISGENNLVVPFQLYKKLDTEIVDRINNSAGIIISSATYNNSEYFRFAFVPILKEKITESFKINRISCISDNNNCLHHMTFVDKPNLIFRYSCYNFSETNAILSLTQQNDIVVVTYEKTADSYINILKFKNLTLK